MPKSFVPKEVKSFETEDGEQFERKQDAIAHQEKLEILKRGIDDVLDGTDLDIAKWDKFREIILRNKTRLADLIDEME
jgi:hypothetical protein